jgi:hypothetical protein
MRQLRAVTYSDAVRGGSCGGRHAQAHRHANLDTPSPSVTALYDAGA